MTLFLSDDDVAAVTDWAAAVKALRDAYAAPLPAEAVPPRGMARGQGVWLRSLTAVSPDGHLGAKLIAASPKTGRVSYLIALFDEAMELDALIDGNRVTGIRTAATSAVAVDALAPARPLRVALLGSGHEARAQLRALAAVRAIADVRVYSPTPASRQRFAGDAGDELGLDVTPVAAAPEATGDADVVACAARSRDESPVLRGEWLSPGTTVVSIGSTLPEQREVDVSVLRRADLIVADVPAEVAHDTGDMIAAAAAGIDVTGWLVSLSDLIAGRVPGRRGAGADGVTVYKSVGSALQDVVVAGQLLATARQRGLGTPLPDTIKPVLK